MHCQFLRSLAVLLLIPALVWAQAEVEDYPEMLDRSNLPRIFEPESELFSNTYRSRGVGINFGVGFRRLDFTLNDGQTRTYADGTANGIAFHLGYLEPERALEYERQVSPISTNKPIEYEGSRYSTLEIIQNNAWYWWVNPFSSRWWWNYGSGLQFAQIRPIAEDQSKTYVDESSVLLGAGMGWFVVPSLLLSYRFALSFHLSELGLSTHDPLLTRSQVHTIYLDYFFPL